MIIYLFNKNIVQFDVSMNNSFYQIVITIFHYLRLNYLSVSS